MPLVTKYPVYVGVKITSEIDAALTKIQDLEHWSRSEAVRFLLTKAIGEYIQVYRLAQAPTVYQELDEEYKRTMAMPESERARLQMLQSVLRERAVEAGPTSP